MNIAMKWLASSTLAWPLVLSNQMELTHTSVITLHNLTQPDTLSQVHVLTFDFDRIEVREQANYYSRSSHLRVCYIHTYDLWTLYRYG